MAAKYKIGAVFFDEDLRIYVKANVHHIAGEVKWAVYEDGKLGEVFDTNTEAKEVCAQLRKEQG